MSVYSAGSIFPAGPGRPAARENMRRPPRYRWRCSCGPGSSTLIIRLRRSWRMHSASTVVLGPAEPANGFQFLQLGQRAGGLDHPGIQLGRRSTHRAGRRTRYRSGRPGWCLGDCATSRCASASCSRCIRRRISSSSAASVAFVPGPAQHFLPNPVELRGDRRAAGHVAGAGQRLQLPGPGLVRAGTRETRDAADQRAGPAIGSQPGIDLVETSRWGQHGEEAEYALGEARVVALGRQGARAVGSLRARARTGRRYPGRIRSPARSAPNEPYPMIASPPSDRAARPGDPAGAALLGNRRAVLRSRGRRVRARRPPGPRPGRTARPGPARHPGCPAVGRRRSSASWPVSGSSGFPAAPRCLARPPGCGATLCARSSGPGMMTAERRVDQLVEQRRKANDLVGDPVAALEQFQHAIEGLGVLHQQHEVGAAAANRQHQVENPVQGVFVERLSDPVGPAIRA